MITSPFVFSSKNLPKLKAKQLSKTFPFLKLSGAQEATARALGYSSWYECSNRGSRGTPSPTDQEAGLSVRVSRYYHQANVLMSIGITPAEADLWVRAWGLTGSPTLAPELAIPTYYEWNSALDRFEQGEIDEDKLVEECGEYGGWSKYPDIDRPHRICPGVILGPMGKYPHYAVDPVVNASIPIYLRGPQCSYHYEDDGDILAVCVPGFPESRRSGPIISRLSPIQHEWHFGNKHPDAGDQSVARLLAEALACPNEMVVLSIRAMPKPDDKHDFHSHAVACARGKDFAKFIRDKGVLDPSVVVWYKDVDGRQLDFLYGLDFGAIGKSLPVFEAANKYQPCLPVYSYPFMTSPMSLDEYGIGMERICLLPLNEDYDQDGDDEDDLGGDVDPPQDPDIPGIGHFLRDRETEPA